jgi:hypothetical protein
MRQTVILLVFYFLVPFENNAQHTNFNTQKNWSLNKRELVFGLGATQFTGDVGGADNIGKDYSLRDINLRATSINGVVGYRYRFKPLFATSTMLNFGILRGDDAFTNEIVRNSRNLHFRSFYVELQQRIEFILFSNEKVGARYRLPGHNHFKDRNEQLYIFTGAGVSYFTSSARYENDWVALRPLKTEGQGLPGGAKEYLPVTATIPFGVGFRWGIGRMWRIGIEATYIKTFTDYIDDVSTVYYDPAQLGSPAAQYLSNPAQVNAGWFAPGQQRGDANNDAYYTLNFLLQRNITYRDFANRRKRYKWTRGRYKF